ncbi:phosphoglucomutase/phosphomannomutase domain-containing protein [Coniochaeta sp. 2T2.1]|nr:phosphoglucomutase/phosphomannomutase domain-containing protein [Coniochaeta sp. 2T2.1]
MSDKANHDKVFEASAKHPTVEGHRYQYGTAGFRMKADLLEGVAFRVGLLASLRSRKLDGQAIGVMITASHNPAIDNGVKIVDPMGEMLEQEWEGLATNLVNSQTHEELFENYLGIAKKYHINLEAPSKVIYGRDTRPSGSTLIKALTDALTAVDSEYIDYKMVTTPQLHYLVRATNTEGTDLSYGEVSETGYYEKLADAFARALKTKTINEPLTVDCANGIGAPKLKEFIKHIPGKVQMTIKVVNDDVIRPEALNHDCGADFVKTRQRAPPTPKPVPGARSCSFDGDADRLIYYWLDPESNTFAMLDGDRIATLAAVFIVDLIRAADLEESGLKVGVVQTAYANGASTQYIANHLKLPVVCTPTGVKHLHHAALSFDVGVYFEANGHGTVLFSREALKTFQTKKPQSPGQKDALETLVALSDLINQTIGDALSDMLMVEVILAHKGWTLRDWAMTYSDLPNKLVRVEVKDKDLFRTTDAERKLSHPEGAQAAINDEVKKYKSARAFARASGTENACRVYAEAATRSEANELAEKVAYVVQRFGQS